MILDIFKQLGDEDPEFDATLKIIEERPWTSTPKDAPISKAVYKAVEAVTGKEPVWQGVPGATDGTILQGIKKIPVIVIGAGNTYIPHHIDEYVEIPALIETAKIYTLISMYFLNNEID